MRLQYGALGIGFLIADYQIVKRVDNSSIVVSRDSMLFVKRYQNELERNPGDQEIDDQEAEETTRTQPRLSERIAAAND